MSDRILADEELRALRDKLQENYVENESTDYNSMLDSAIAKTQDAKTANYYEQVVIPERIKQAERELIEEIETFHIANCMRTVKRYQCKECVCGDFICQWQQIKQKRGM